jgi:hypothetical protein
MTHMMFSCRHWRQNNRAKVGALMERHLKLEQLRMEEEQLQVQQERMAASPHPYHPDRTATSDGL